MQLTATQWSDRFMDRPPGQLMAKCEPFSSAGEHAGTYAFLDAGTLLIACQET
jgi:hypothetical protein